MVVAARPLAIAREGAPTTVTAALVVVIGRIARDGRSGALPEHRVGGVPARTKLELLQIGKAQVVTIDIHDVEEQTCRPRTDAAAEA